MVGGLHTDSQPSHGLTALPDIKLKTEGFIIRLFVEI